MSSLSRAAAPLLLLHLAGCGRFTVDDSRAVLVGQVLTADSAPVSGARVLLITGRSPEREVRTGADGRFTSGAARERSRAWASRCRFALT
jgi:hypothetical protein